MKIKMEFASYETLGFESLIYKPSHFYTLAYCRSTHLISIEFQLTMIWTPYHKNVFSPSIVIILQSVWSF
jgi:hypothetical protein